MDSLAFLKPTFSGWTLTILLLAVAYALVVLPYKTEKDADECSLDIHQTFTLYSKRVVTPKGVIPAAVDVHLGKITGVTKRAAPPEGSDTHHVVDLGTAVLSPGLVDVHVHMNEPGRADWEGVETGTHAAAAGGITTVVDMPLNSKPTTTTVEAFNLKLKETAGKMMVDVGFWGGLVPDNAANVTALEELLRAGVLGLKSFMCPSGIDDFPATNSDHFAVAMPILAKYGRPLYIHAEVAKESEETEQAKTGDPRKYETYLATRPDTMEKEAIRQIVEVALKTRPGEPYEGARLHIAHLGDADSLPIIQEAKDAGADLSVETCTHYISFSAEMVKDGQTQFKCAPPLRSAENRKKLWQALQAGQIDFLTSDHSPAPPEMKLLDKGNFLEAWGGISGLQFGLPATWTYGQDYGVTLDQVAQWWSSKPAAWANLPSKGSIEVGKDADLVVWDPEAAFMVDETFAIHHKHKVTPYSGLKLKGQVLRTYVRGMRVYQNGMHAPKACGGHILARP